MRKLNTTEHRILQRVEPEEWHWSHWFNTSNGFPRGINNKTLFNLANMGYIKLDYRKHKFDEGVEYILFSGWFIKTKLGSTVTFTHSLGIKEETLSLIRRLVMSRKYAQIPFTTA